VPEAGAIIWSANAGLISILIFILIQMARRDRQALDANLNMLREEIRRLSQSIEDLKDEMASERVRTEARLSKLEERMAGRVQ
jgi:cell division protein FtsB